MTRSSSEGTRGRGAPTHLNWGGQAVGLLASSSQQTSRVIPGAVRGEALSELPATQGQEHGGPRGADVADPEEARENLRRGLSS